MIPNSFLEWVKIKEARLVGGTEAVSNPFLYLDQKQGDFVYFGVHDLAKFYKSNGFLPSTLDIATVLPKTGRIEDANSINRTISVLTDKDPFKFGYKKLETRDQREKRKTKNVDTINLSANHLVDITSMLGTGAELSGQKLWLVVDGNTPFQQKIMQQIRKKEAERKTQVDPTPKSYDVNPDQVANVRNWLTGKGSQAEIPAAQANFNQLMPNEPEETPQQRHYRLRKRGLLSGDNMKLRGQIQSGTLPDTTSGLDVASFNPLWKPNNDDKIYAYFD